MSDLHPDTAAVHAGRLEIPSNRASSPPLFQASSYEFADLENVEEIYSGRVSGKIYGRYGGPNGAQLELAVAELEGAEAAAGAAAGMAAIDACLATTLDGAGEIVATGEAYGGTFALLENDYRKRGFDVHYVDQCDLGVVRAALERHRPKALYIEALTNPLMHVADLPALCALAHEAGATAIVDATFATPVLVRPLEHGADLVVHSLGKYIGGHGDVGAGVLAGKREPPFLGEELREQLGVLASAAITFWMLGYARRRGMVDRPSERSSHSVPTPRGGGRRLRRDRGCQSSPPRVPVRGFDRFG